MTSWASPGSIFTNALMTASSLNSCARTICAHATAQANRHHAASREPRTFISLLAMGQSTRWIDNSDRANRRCRRVTRACELTSQTVGSVVALVLVVVAPDRDELLDAAAVDRLAGVEVALRVEHDAVQERELACLESRRAKPGEDLAAHAAHDVQDLVAAVGLEHEPLPIVLGEREVPGRARRAEPRRAADSQRHPGTGNDRNDPHWLAEHALIDAGLGEDLDAVIGAVAHVKEVVVASRDAVRVTAVPRGE